MKQENVDVLMLGMEGAGKSLLAKRMKSICDGSNEKLSLDVVSTVGVELRHMSYGRCAINVREVGGSMVPVWHKYYAGCDMLVYVVDPAAPHLLSSSVYHLSHLLSEPGLASKPILLVFSKSDMPCPMSDVELEMSFQWPQLQAAAGNRLSLLQGCSAADGIRVADVLAWIVQQKAQAKAG